MDLAQQNAISIIKPLIPPDAEERVLRTVKQSNSAIRDHIRTETALKLASGDGRGSIAVRVVEGLPAPLADIINRYPDPVLWRLIAAQPRLGAIIDGLNFLLEDWGAFECWPDLPSIAHGSGEALARARDVAWALQQVAHSDRVKKELADIHEDILGCYHFSQSRLPWVEIYWMPTALFAGMLHLRIEDLTVVVLAHELAHGYTHQGCDIDGRSWETSAFSGSHADVVEGLAQFYADLVTDRMSIRAPGAHEAYKKLLALQSGPYRAHEEWLKGQSERKREAVRFALLATRGEVPATNEAWNQLLIDASRRLRGTLPPSDLPKERTT